MKRVTPDIGMDFIAVEDTLQDILPPDPFQGATSQIPGRAITSLPFKQAGIYLPNPTQNAGENWTASCVITGHLVAELRRKAKVRYGNHSLLIGEGR